MTALGFLTTLQSLGVEVSAVGERLRYRAPDGTVTPALREEMVRHKEEILALLHETQSESYAPAINMDAGYPLLPAQERLWFMHQLVPDTSLYNESVAVRLSGALKIAALAQALNELSRRHEALRTSFESVEGEPRQYVSQEASPSLMSFDLGRLPEGARGECSRELVRGMAAKPFNLSQLPFIRVGLISVGPQEHLLVLSLHHIICDGWSRGILAREMSRLYDSYSRGEASALAEPDLQYSDFALWQKERISRGQLDHEMEYWSEQLSESLPLMDLPTDRARPPFQTYRGASCDFELSRDLGESLRESSRANGVTSYMTLLATWEVLLGRYCAQEELIVGTVAANRTSAELENVVGLMVNTLVIKGDLTGNPTFKELLGRVRAVAIGAYKHQELPYEKLVAELATGRAVGRRPIVELMFVMEQSLAGQVELNGLTAREEKVDSRMAKYDLMIVLREKAGGFEGRIEYNADLFDEPRIMRMAEHYKQVLRAVVAEPDGRIWDLPLLTKPEQLMLFTEWNDTSFDHENHDNVHRMFEKQVEVTPNAIAAVYNGAHLTYGELNRRVNRLAHHLRSLGVKPDVLVGLCVERTLEMGIGMLAILKAGGAYLPLDLAYPKHRLSFMIEDAQSPVLLTQSHLLERLPDSGATVVCMDSCGELTDVENLADVATADDLAYVIYTSGSTGRPKGVSLPHGALANLIKWHTSEVVSKVRTLQFASLSFDVSFYEISTTWTTGGTLLIVSDEFRLDIPRLAGFLSDNRIEKAVLPVVVLQQLAEEHGFRKQGFDSLKKVITTGEQLQITKPVVRFFEDFSHCSLENHYGPSETHVVTSASLSGPPDSWPVHPSIGRPIMNAQMYLLDPAFNPAPSGAIAELHVGGVALARGYLNRSDLTAERFVPNPCGGRPGERLYKTGDLVRYRHDGNIDYLGRANHQLKIRGFRVELGEVESVLGQHPAVREAVVVTREEVQGNKRLVAFVAADRKQNVTAAELRSYLKETLPDYMLPSAFTILERLPLTPNGKVDRKALAMNHSPVVEQAEEPVPARTPAEELVAQIWREALGVEKIHINSNFFSLGGHSLLATQIILRLRDIFRVEVPVRSMFDTPTISGIVKTMSAIWGGREIVEEIAWTHLQVGALSDEAASALLAQQDLCESMAG